MAIRRNWGFWLCVCTMTEIGLDVGKSDARRNRRVLVIRHEVRCAVRLRGRCGACGDVALVERLSRAAISFQSTYFCRCSSSFSCPGSPFHSDHFVVPATACRGEDRLPLVFRDHTDEIADDDDLRRGELRSVYCARGNQGRAQCRGVDHASMQHAGSFTSFTQVVSPEIFGRKLGFFTRLADDGVT